MSEPGTAALILVGDELLSGAVVDHNGAWLIRELRALGTQVREMHVVPDEIDRIVEALDLVQKRSAFVLVSGGIGPTHDDVTLAAVAQAFGVGLAIHPALEAHLHETFAHDAANLGGWRRMARLPEGCALCWGDSDAWPTYRMENVWIFPGSPPYLHRQFGAIRGQFAGPGRFAKAEVLLRAQEGQIAERLAQIAAQHPAVKIGSYPSVSKDDAFAVKLVIQGREHSAVEAAGEALRAAMEPQWLL